MWSSLHAILCLSEVGGPGVGVHLWRTVQWMQWREREEGNECEAGEVQCILLGGLADLWGDLSVPREGVQHRHPPLRPG